MWSLAMHNDLTKTLNTYNNIEGLVYKNRLTIFTINVINKLKTSMVTMGK